jgi:hypothetical protein
VALAVAVLTLSIGPWLGLPSGAPAAQWSAFATAGWGHSLVSGIVRDDPILPAAAPTGCTCREITIEAKNVVRDADVETGDAEVVNRSITYVAPTYGDDDIDVDQEAVAKSGDAVAGQILAVNGGPGCSRVRVHATNIVENADVKSGNATARNESLILLDPRLPSGELEIDVDQEAVAKSGDAVAGQIIGIRGGGGPCGGVILDALNDVRNVDVQSGDASMKNVSNVLTCKEAGCLDEVRRYLLGVDSVEVCDGEDCTPVSPKKFVGMLKDSIDDNTDADTAPDLALTPGPDPSDGTVSEADGTPRPTLGPPFVRRERRTRNPEPSPSPDASPSPSPSAAPSG